MKILNWRMRCNKMEEIEEKRKMKNKIKNGIKKLIKRI